MRTRCARIRSTRCPIVGRRIIAAAVAAALTGTSVQAAPLDPSDFTSLGVLNVASGSITIDTVALTISGAANFNGVINPDGITVFAFDDFNISPGVTINVVGSRRLALLSQGSMTLGSAINLNGGDGGVPGSGQGVAGGSAGGFGGTTGGAGFGTGGGGGGPAVPHDAGGGGFGGAGGFGDTATTAGIGYGDLWNLLEAGSGGGGANEAGGNAGGGGAGGGAIQLGAIGVLSVASLTTNGGAGGGGTYHGGGGSGGGILLNAGSIVFTGLPSAKGGEGSGFGGAGGGGRITLGGGSVSVSQLTLQALTVVGAVNGGSSTVGAGNGNGTAGVLSFRHDLVTVESGDSLPVGIIPNQTGRTDPRLEYLPNAIEIQSGGSASLVSPITWGSLGGVYLTGGEFNVNNDTSFTSGSSFYWTAGALNIASGRTMTFDGGVASVTAGGYTLPDNTALRIINGGQFDTDNYFDLPYSAGGTLLVSGATSFFRTGGAFALWAANVDGSATVTFSDSGVGSFDAGLQIGVNGGTALVNIITDGELSTASLLTGGNASSNVTININGGSLNTGAAEFLTGTTVNLDGAALVMQGDATFSAGSTLNWGDGDIVFVNHALTIDGGAAVVTGGKGLRDGATLRITNEGGTGGSLTTNSYLDVGNSGTGGATGSLLVLGSGSSFTSTATDTVFGFTDWSRFSGDSAMVTFADSGVGSFNAGLAIGRDGGAAMVDINSNAQLSTASLRAGSEFGASDGVTINVNGAALSSTGFSKFFEGAQLNLQTGGSISFGGNTTFSTGSTFNWTGGSWSHANGTTLAFDGGTGSFAADIYSVPSGGTLRVANGGLVHALGILAGASGPSGTITIAGGSLLVDSNLVLMEDAVMNYSAGSLTVTGGLVLLNDAQVLLTPGGDKVVRVGDLAMGFGNTIDLADNDMVITNFTSPENDLRIAMFGGLITSSSAGTPAGTKLGYADNAFLGKTEFAGQSVDSNDMLIKFTYAGDANLDGQVTISDLGDLASNWQSTSAFWRNGDFNYDGSVTISDLGDLASNWQAGVGSPLGMSFAEALAAVGLGEALVPEPGVLALAFTSFGMCLRRRRT